MSNRHRKTIATNKRQRNLLIRLARGARKHGGNWPGDGTQYQTPPGHTLSTQLQSQKQNHHTQTQTLLLPYWRGH